MALLALAGCAATPSAPAAAPAAATAPSPAPAAAPWSTSPAEPGDRVAAPSRVRLASLDVDVEVVDVGVDDRGEMEVPQDVSTVGWYRFGPRPGAAAGSAVLSGHVDDRVQGEGAFHRLSELIPGDPVEVELADGAVVAYVVDRVRRIAKEELPVDELFARDGAPVLTLVTCGGDFDREARSYRENVVVTASPTGDGAA
ncbi:class F sortase [Pseudonocardia sp. KRD-184]|uniref:Class F sortase n=1 Tax=Pseudonocardia oceani TaxID=2792013 RepID=A0ABS6U3Z6_9PSEU|nr:class F sortase [Pseudonocardia oceani]MBW0090399.1 class F sortase [Pseudonocardia oceani]MBW0096685.1 class F sortase [Pseudonocardia oceani]MBW0108408.1 class F sortase [Pseudonocardia oceani]MBW0126955.1 class F sortase [Pseudonocardia oceani]